MKKRILSYMLTLVLIVSLSGLAVAQDEENKKNENFSGSFLVGYRSVDLSGVETKYMEDFNLQTGPRLFNFNFNYQPTGKLNGFVDRVNLAMYNFGGDPFETFRLDVTKYGAYQFTYDRKKSTYFYHDILMDHDFHQFDFDRIIDSSSLKIWLAKNARFYVNFNRQSKKGESITSLDIGRVEFEFEKPVDEMSLEYTVGLDFNVKRFGFVFEEKIQDYKNANSFFLPGYADGGNFARYPTALNYFYLNMPYDFKAYNTTVKVNAKPFDSLLIRASGQLINQDTNISYSESAAGKDYLGYGFEYNSGGSGSFERKMKLYDVDLTYLMGNKFALVGAVRSADFTQNGTFNGSSAALDYDTLGFEGGLQFQLSPAFGVSAGVRSEARDLKHGSQTDTTKRFGLFGNFNWKLTDAWNLIADYQFGDYKDPYTLTAPTEFNRLRFSTKFKQKNFSMSASYLYNKSKAKYSDSLWESAKNQLNFRVGYHNTKIKLSASYGLIDIKHDGSRQIVYPPGWGGPQDSFLWDILYEGKANLLDASLHWSLSDNWGLGGYFNSYTNTGTWEISRAMLKAFLQYTMDNGFVGQFGYRLIDFKEKIYNLNDYKANILEFSFGYHW